MFNFIGYNDAESIHLIAFNVSPLLSFLFSHFFVQCAPLHFPGDLGDPDPPLDPSSDFISFLAAGGGLIFPFELDTDRLRGFSKLADLDALRFIPCSSPLSFPLLKPQHWVRESFWRARAKLRTRV